MLTIELNNLRFHAFHGLYPEERSAGNEFEVNLSVSYIPDPGTVTDLSSTIDYGELYQLVKTEMASPRSLLETFVMETAEKIHHEFPRIKKLTLSVAKLHLPIAGFTGSSCVRIEKEY